MDVLEAFADEQGITYDLLSDEGSVVLERLGLVNPHIGAQQAFYGRPVDERHNGLPYPATLVLDEAGTVVERVFEQSYRPRPSAGSTLRLVSGVPPRAARSATARDGAVSVTASVDSASFRPMEIRELYVELLVAGGWHLYTEPVPEGFTPLQVEVSADSDVATWPPQLPAGWPFTVKGLHEQFFVVDGTVLLSVPFMLPGSRFGLDGRDRPEPGPRGPVRLQVRVAYQACSDAECLPPTTQHLTLTLDEERLVRPT